MRRRLGLMALAAGLAGVALGSEGVSPAFRYDSSYAPSGIDPSEWEVEEVWATSGRFAAATVERALDLNGNGIPDEWEAKYGLTGANAAADADPDGDGRTNIEEYNAGTNPVVAEDYAAAAGVPSGRCVVDTWIEALAGAGIGDLAEVWSLSAAFRADTVGRDADTDGDGMPDWWERLHGLDPYVDDAHLDKDGDGRTNIEEYNAGTNPGVAENWQNGVRSGEAFVCDTRVWQVGGNPEFGETFAVFAVSGGFVCDTGGLYYDWDGDGIPNWWEARYSRSGSKTGLVAAEDDDGDGLSNYEEFVAYTNPTNAQSRFTVELAGAGAAGQGGGVGLLSVQPRGAGGFALRWQSAKGRTYSVYAGDNIGPGWDAAPVAEVEGTGEVVEWTPGVSGRAMFFKVSVRLSDDYGAGR